MSSVCLVFLISEKKSACYTSITGGINARSIFGCYHMAMSFRGSHIPSLTKVYRLIAWQRKPECCAYSCQLGVAWRKNEKLGF